MLLDAPESIPVVKVGAAGVTGSTGLVQSLFIGPLSESNPNPRFKLFSNGYVPWQHRLAKSSRSIVQAAAPPNPDDLTY